MAASPAVLWWGLYGLRSRLDLLAFEVAHVGVVKEAVFLGQPPLCALCDDLPFIDHDDIIRLPDRAQAVGHHKGIQPWLSILGKQLKLMNLLRLGLQSPNQAIFERLHSTCNSTRLLEIVQINLYRQ